jgi:integrase
MISKKYYLRKPDGKRKSFVIVERTILENGKTKDQTLSIPEVALINKNLEAGIIDQLVAEKNLKLIIERLSPRAVHNQDNYKIVDEYWNREYSLRDLVDPDTAKYALRRSIESIGNLPLASATREELQRAVNQFKGNRQRRLVAGLNQLLKFLGRPERLLKARPERYKVKYLTEPEKNKVLTYIEDPLDKLLHEVCFYTGMRIGEAFAVTKLENDILYVESQIDRNGLERDTKNRKIRKAYIAENGLHFVKEWLKKRHDYSKDRTQISKITDKACRLAFPDNEEKHCTFHDLRHSYAIMLLGKGVPISFIAQSIGNSVSVCEKHYTGFKLSDESIDLIRKLMKGRP